jgi:hypothetical protein
MLLKRYCLFFVCCSIVALASAQSDDRPQLRGGRPGAGAVSYDRQGRPIKNSAGKNDSLQTRNSLADSITIFYKHFDSTKLRTLDSSINDFSRYFPLPYTVRSLGNLGTATQSLLFNPYMKAGFNAGFHGYDMYNYTLENTKFYETTRPFTELAFILGARAEQVVDFLHTQNKKDNFNFSLQYRFSNSPGALKNQNANLNNLRFTSHFKSNNRKYELFFVFLSNKNASSENGGLQNPNKLDSLSLNDPYELETRLGKSAAASRNPFNTNVSTGNIYTSSQFVIRQQFDIGKKDSSIVDSVTYRIFYPRLRLQHTLSVASNVYQFLDNNVDSSSYQLYFNKIVPSAKSIIYKDSWQDITNEFSILTFPDKNNQSQYLKTGIAYQALKGTFDTTSSISFYNIYAVGAYKNRSRNKVWDIDAHANLYLNGQNAGDYEAAVYLQRYLGSKAGYLSLGFNNVNRSPAFVLDPLSSFRINANTNFAKENSIRLMAKYEKPNRNLSFTAHYYGINNYMYFDGFFAAKQASGLFNLLQLSLQKKWHLKGHWNWYTEMHVQQKIGTGPVNVPLFYTRNRLAFEGNFFTNLDVSTGLEMQYFTAYNADGYSPFLGAYFYQNSQKLSNRPDIHAFFHFRIKRLKGFIRIENLNSLNTAKGFSFSKPNFMTALYPNTTLWTRIGIWWNFIN